MMSDEVLLPSNSQNRTTRGKKGLEFTYQKVKVSRTQHDLKCVITSCSWKPIRFPSFNVQLGALRLHWTATAS